MGSDTDPKSVAQNISEEAGDILLVAGAKGGVCNTRDLTKSTGLENDTVAHHVSYHLLSRDLLKKTGKDESVDMPNPPNQYRLTEAGKEVVGTLNEWRDDSTSEPATSDADLQAIKELREEIDDMQKTINMLTEKIHEHQDTIDFVEQRRGR